MSSCFGFAKSPRLVPQTEGNDYVTSMTSRCKATSTFILSVTLNVSLAIEHLFWLKLEKMYLRCLEALIRF